MELKVINEENSLVSVYLRELRDVNVQTDRLRFRKNLERIGSIMAYEISKSLEYENINITTPISDTEVSVIKDRVVLSTILRAGIPFHDGFLEFFDKSECSFISAHRVEKENCDEISIEVNYATTPSLEGKVLIIIDTMLATGISILHSLQKIIEIGGMPRHIHFASVFAAPEGLEYIKQNIGLENCTFWTATLDKGLTPKFYINPGLGDAGDLAYGKKI